MLCFMCPTVTGVGFGYSWTMRTQSVCLSCVQVLLLVVVDRVSGVYY